MTMNTVRYTNIAIILHWVIAVAVLLMLASGLTMEYATLSQSFKFTLIQWHKSLGVIVLVAVFLRLAWRLMHKPPALPASIKGLEAIAAKLGHLALYACMIIMPLSGWLMVSASPYGLPTIVFGWFEWPHIPGVAMNDAVNSFAKQTHFIFAISFAVIILGHVGAVVKHALCERENLLTRMWWTK